LLGTICINDMKRLAGERMAGGRVAVWVLTCRPSLELTPCPDDLWPLLGLGVLEGFDDPTASAG